MTLRPDEANHLRFFFFFQAEDGIRDKLVTGVQTCALPISDFTAIISATMTAVHATPTPRRSPVKIDGSAEGKTTLRRIVVSPAPSIRAARSRRRFVSRTPCVVFTTIG